VRAILIRTQFLPTVRHVIGWRGLKQSSAEVEAWTAKVKGFAGVFGLFFLRVEPLAGWITGRFGLCYFPDPEEPLVERLSLQAAAFTQNENYHFNIRDFLQHPQMKTLFGIGNLLLSVRNDQRALALAMQAVSRQRTVARDGVCLPREGKMVQLVEPGGCDEDFPAFETTLGFFDVLAASVTFNVEQAPHCFIERRSPATQRVYDRSGNVSLEDAPGLWNGLLALGYGEGDFDALWPAVGGKESVPVSDASADGPEAAPRDYRDRLWWRAHLLKDSRSVDRKFLGVDERPPFIILTGFLGSGKTSFLQHFIEYQTQRSRFVAVIQNEIGAVGLDGKLLDYTVTEIDEACVCCSLAGNLKRAVQGILESFSPDYMILETSGLANPLNLLDEMTALDDLLRFDSTVTIVDAANLDAALAHGPIAVDQIRAADIVVLNKRDVVDESRLEAVRRRVREINPRALLFCTVQGDMNPALIFDAEDSAIVKPQREKSASQYTLREISPMHPAHADVGLWSKSLKLLRALDRERFLQAVSLLPPSVFRAKGLIDFADRDETMLFQYVCGRFDLSEFRNRGVRERFLTFIGTGGESGIEEMLEALSMAPLG
jgi:G3E family GTPase